MLETKKAKAAVVTIIVLLILNIVMFIINSNWKPEADVRIKNQPIPRMYDGPQAKIN